MANPWKLHRIDGGNDRSAVVGYCSLLLLHGLEFVKEPVEHDFDKRRHIGHRVILLRRVTPLYLGDRAGGGRSRSAENSTQRGGLRRAGAPHASQ